MGEGNTPGAEAQKSHRAEGFTNYPQGDSNSESSIKSTTPKKTNSQDSNSELVSILNKFFSLNLTELKELKEKEKKYYDLYTQLRETQTKLSETEDKLQSEKNNCADWKQRYDSMFADEKDGRTSFFPFGKNSKADLEKKVAELEGKFSERVNTIEAWKKYCEKTQQKLDELQEKYDGLSAENKNYLAENAELEANYNADEQKIADLNKIISKLEEEKENLRKEKNTEISDLKAEKEKIRQDKDREISSLKADKENLANQKNGLENEKRDLSRKNDELSRTVSEKDSKIDSLNSEISDCKNTNEKLQDRIKKLEVDLDFSGNNLSKKVDEVKSLNSQLDEKKTEIQQLNEKLNSASTENDNLRSSMDTAVSLANRKLEAIDFDNALKAFETYKSLPDEIHKSLNNTFQTDRLLGFIAAGLQRENIENFYDFVAQRVRARKYENLEELSDVFKYFFSFYNKSFETPRYELITVESGARYDGKFHFNRESKSDGLIEKMELFGYKDTKTNAIKRAIVIIKQ